jgi:hypothetical protein
MAILTVALNAERLLPVVTGSARLPFFHLLHGHFFMLGNAQVRLVVTLLAGKAGGVDVAVVAEGHIPILHFKEDIASSDLRVREGGQEQSQADADGGNNFHSHTSFTFLSLAVPFSRWNVISHADGMHTNPALLLHFPCHSQYSEMKRVGSG